MLKTHSINYPFAYLYAIVISLFIFTKAHAQVNLNNSLTVHYDFDEQINDQSSNNLNGILQGAFLGEDRFGQQNRALNFNAHLQLASIPSSIIDGLSDITVSTWVKTTVGGAWITAANSSRPNELVLQVLEDGRIAGNIRNIHNIPGVAIIGNTNIKDGNWHHVAIIRDGSTGESFIYLDGLLDGQATMPAGSLTVDNGGLFLGNDQDCVGGCWEVKNQWIGSIDDLRIYNRKINSDEIKLLADGIKPIFTSSTTASFEENGMGTAYTAIATDANTITYSLGFANDESLFDIMGSTGVVTFKNAPDFENPADANTDNNYVIEVKANDGINTASQIITISVTNVDDINPIFISSPRTQINDNQEYEYKIITKDFNGNTVKISSSGNNLPKWLKLETKISNRVTTIAGNGSSGHLDGSKLNTQFENPSGIAINSIGDLFIADLEGHVIRKITSAGVVTTFAGSGVSGFADGNGLNAQFNGPRGLHFDQNGNLYVADTRNHKIRKITPEGIVTTIAGSTAGYLDANGANAKFNGINDLTIDSNNNIYVTDGNNNRIRKIDSNGEVTTIAGNGNPGYLDGTGLNSEFNAPWGIAIDNQNNLYIAGNSDHSIRKITPSGMVITLAGSGTSAFTDGSGNNASFQQPAGLTFGNDGNLYVADTESNAIRKVTLSGVVTTVAGGSGYNFVNGIGVDAGFRMTTDVEMDNSGNLYVADQFNHSIRKISTSGLFLRGNANVTKGNYNIYLIAENEEGGKSQQEFSILISDVTPPLFTSGTTASILENSTLPAYTASAKDLNNVTYSLGNQNDENSFNIDAKSGIVRFNSAPDFENPTDSNSDNTYIIKIIANDGNNSATKSVSIEVKDVNDGELSFISEPETTVSHNETYRYLIETHDPGGKKVSINASNLPSWLSLNTIAEVTSINGAGTAITQDSNGDFFVTSGNQIKKIDQAGNVTVVAGSGDFAFADGVGTSASFALPTGITIGPDDNIYVADTQNSRIRKVTKAGVVTTLAGAGPNGFDVKDGPALQATFVWPNDLAFDSKGNLFVLDNRSHSLRKIDTNGNVTTFVGKGIKVFVNRGNGPTLAGLDGSFADGTGVNARFNSPSGMVINNNDYIFIADTYNHRIRRISPSGVVTTIAGSTQGSVDGPTSIAQLEAPSNIIQMEDGRLFFTEGGRVRMISTEGIVSTIAGNLLANELLDGFGINALFTGIRDLHLANDGKLYIPDDFNGKLRKLSLLRALEGNPFDKVGNYDITLTATNSDGQSINQDFTLQVKDIIAPYIKEIIRVNPAKESIQAKSVGFRIRFSEKVLNVDHHDFQIETGGVTGFIRNVTKDFFEDSVYYLNVNILNGKGLVDLRVVSGTDITDLQGNKLGNLIPSDLEEVFNITTNNIPNINSIPILEVNDNETYNYKLAIADQDFDSLSLNNSTLPNWLSISSKKYTVETLAGSTYGYKNATGEKAQFQGISKITVDRFGNSFVSEGNRIRKITPSGETSTFTTLNGRFIHPNRAVSGTSLGVTGMVTDDMGNLFVSGNYRSPLGDYFRIERISSLGERQVIAGGPGISFADGQGESATFKHIQGLAIDKDGNLIVADEGNNMIRKVTPTGLVTTIAGSNKGFRDGVSNQVQFNAPKDIAIDSNGNIFVVDSGNNRIRKISINGLVSTFAGSDHGYLDGLGQGAKFSGPLSITIDPDDNLFISDTGNDRIRKIDPFGNVTTLAGSGRGFENGMALDSKFNTPVALTMDGVGNLIVLDLSNSRVRKISRVYSLEGSAIGQTGSHSVNLVLKDSYNGSNTQSFKIKINDVTAPVFTSKTTSDFEENGTGTAYVSVATDTNIITYSLGTSNDENLFNIEGNSGVVTFKNSPDFENPTDTNTDNTYVIEVIANDGINTETLIVTITVTNVDDTKPVFTSPVSVNFEENGIGTVYTAVATDANTITYNLGDSNDEALFNIDGNTGAVTFKNSPDFESPSDANSDNNYVIEIKANDGINTASLTTAIYVTDISDEIAPVFTSETTVSFEENGTGTAYTATATDANSITYSLGSTSDESLFNIDTNSGVVTFKNSPDFENPADANTDNAYMIEVIANDGINTETLTVTITVTDVDDTKPVFTSAVSVNFQENGTGEAYTATATDVNTITYGLGSTNDESLFNIDTNSGVVTFKNSPDFENPADANTDNAYIIEVIANDGINTEILTVTITVTDVDDTKPVFTSAVSVNFQENGTGEAYTASATDVNTIAYGLGSTNDESLFNIDTNSGVVTFKSSPDFENPADANTDNAYIIEVIANDGINTEILTVTITVTDVDDTKPVFTSAISVNFQENGTGEAYTATATDVNTITYGLGSTNDESLFNIDTNSGVVTFKSSPDFENPADANTDNAYIIEVIANDGINTETLTVTITVTNEPEAFIRISGEASFPATALGLTSSIDITIHNDGDADLTIENIHYPEGFTGEETLTVSPSSSQTLVINFSPLEARTYFGNIDFTSNGGNITLAISANGEIITSIDNGVLVSSSILIYPNPATDKITIDLSKYSSTDIDIEFINPIGNSVLQISSYKNEILSLDVSEYPNGVYILRLGNANSVITKKVIIKR